MSDGFVQRGGLWVLAQSVILSAIALLGLIDRHSPSGPVMFYGSWVCFAIAACCGLLGMVALGRNLTPFPKPKRASQFVQHGIYRHLRHPLYVAVFCTALGWALIWASWAALFGCLLLAVLFDAKARREERWLRARFPEYAGYERRVRRFIPWIY